MMVAYGTDIDCVDDLGPVFGLRSDLANLGAALARRLMTPRGTLIYDPDYGYDLRGMLNSSITQATAASLQSSIEAECEKDPRVLRCDATVALVTATSSLTVTLTITTADGPFELVLAVTAVTVSILRGTST